ncbi:TonB-dependent receptor domain-containing protein [Massilia sp. 9I]|uniref:TonB-dependent receptor domain-containing protein n=1 Tax=Massilia sp. 9I TaxID=2653152 RepID=UPI0012EFA512|nr:TonB-dependent receptor [Massilia sp. 9I]VXC51804.1 Iron complex outermembrane receptor protein [Massilia sp. 9I]
MNKSSKMLFHAQRPIASAVALALLAMAGAAQAQSSSDQSDAGMSKVEVTGTSFKRAVADQALPVTVVKAEEWIAQGMLTIDDILMSMSTASVYQPNTTAGNGNSANMRGIGSSRTLVLIDGKRVNDSSINPNVIPVSALDRTEVLRDGASSIYGSDAIGGVMNFVTKKSYTGASVTLKGTSPVKNGGGQSKGASFIVGKGDLAKDGWNVYLTADFNHQNELPQSARPELTTDARRQAAGFAPFRATRGTNSVPANVTLANGSTRVGNLTITGNPYYSSGCLPPYTTPGTNNTCYSLFNANNLTLTKEGQQASVFSKGTLAINPDHRISASLLYSSIYNRPVKNPTYGIAASIPNFPALTIGPTSPYYPGKGIVPAMPGITNQTLTLAWSLIGDLGPTVLNYDTETARANIDLDGRVGAWDYRASLWSALYRSHVTFRSGFVNSYGLLAGVANGKLNPFGLQNEEGRAYLDSISTNGQTADSGLNRLHGLDLSGSRELMDMAGGPMMLALGANAYHDSAYHSIPDTVVQSGGQTGTTAAVNERASRNVVAAYAELELPLTKALNVNVAVRTDHYSDFGSTTNPKLSFRYKANDVVMLRGAVGTGFRAPTLSERYFGAVNGPTGLTSDSYNDPVLCPGGAPGASTGGTALPGYNTTRVCAARQPINTGANPEVGPERSTTINFGAVFTPTRSLLVSLDYFNVKLRDAIGQLAQNAIFTNPAYANLFIRDANKNLLWVDDRRNNLGGVRTDGIDVTATYTFPRTSYGRVGVQLDGTYLHRFDTQVENGGEWISSINKFGPLDANAMNFRWKYGASIKWTSPKNAWSTTLNEQYKQSFEDRNADSQFYHRIDSYRVYNWSVTYSGYPKLKVTAGINNLFDRDPPVANYRNEGYASGMASPVGRTVVARATYTF